MEVKKDERVELEYCGKTEGLGYKFFNIASGEFVPIEPAKLLGCSILVYGQVYSLRRIGASYLVEGRTCENKKCS